MKKSGGDIVGHKTFRKSGGGFRHEPLRRDEASSIIEQCERAEQKRREVMPDEQSAIRALFDAYQRLKELGWNDAIYCPKDGSVFDAIEAGSTGIYECRHDGQWPDGHWWVLSHGDMYPSRPILYRKRDN